MNLDRLLALMAGTGRRPPAPSISDAAEAESRAHASGTLKDVARCHWSPEGRHSTRSIRGTVPSECSEMLLPLRATLRTSPKRDWVIKLPAMRPAERRKSFGTGGPKPLGMR